MFNKTDFALNYGKIVTRTWEDDSYRSELLSDPRRVLTEGGITVPENVQINIVQMDATGKGDPLAYADRWEQGIAAGNVEFLLASKPAGVELNDVPLSDEMLSAIYGGTGDGTLGGCCCCCPCCFSISLSE